MILMKKGKVLACGADFDPLIDYASPVTTVHMWRFEGSYAGKLALEYEDGAVGEFISDDFQNLLEYARTVEAWPEPTVYPGFLPRIGVPLFGFVPEPVQEVTAVAHVARKRKVKAEVAVHVTRKRGG